MGERSGISYLRTTREKTESLYSPGDSFPIGCSKTLRSSKDDQAAIVAAGGTVFEAIKAADDLTSQGIPVQVIDAYSVKPIDAATLRKALGETGFIVVVEDHWIEGGLGDAVLSALADAGRPLSGHVVKLEVREMPGSATPEEQ